jgi:carbon storage regulator
MSGFDVGELAGSSKLKGVIMLVLTRKDEESIVINNDIKVTVKMHRGSVRLLIDAPRHIPVKRGELVDREKGPKED